MIEGMMQKQSSVTKLNAKLTRANAKIAGLTHFLKANYNNGSVTPMHAQESFRLHSFAQANCLLLLEELKGNYEVSDEVEVHLI